MTDTEKRPGFYGWSLACYLWVIYTILIGFISYASPVIYPFMIQELGWSRGQVMIGFTGIGLMFGLTAPFIAWLIGKIGARITIVLGASIAAVSALFIALGGGSYPVFLVLSLSMGFGGAMGSAIPVQTVITFWFNARRALALGLVLAGAAIGGFVAPQAVGFAVKEAAGNWRVGYVVIAAISVLAGAVAFLKVRNRPTDIGQYQDGLSPESIEEAAASERTRTAGTYRSPVSWSLSDAVHTRSLWLLAFGGVGALFMWIIVTSQGPFHLRDQGFSPEMTAFFYSLAIGLSVLGRLTVAFIGDRVEPYLVAACGAASCLAGGILFWFASPQAMWAAYLYPLMAGFGVGLTLICVPTIIGNYWGDEAFAPISGLVMPIQILFPAISGPFAGYIYDIQGSYWTVMCVSWSGAALAVVAFLLCTPPHVKEVAPAVAD